MMEDLSAVDYDADISAQVFEVKKTLQDIEAQLDALIASHRQWSERVEEAWRMARALSAHFPNSGNIVGDQQEDARHAYPDPLVAQ